MFPVEQSRRLRGIVSWPLARLNRAGRRRYRANSLHLALLVESFPLEKLFFSAVEGRIGQDRTGQDGTGQVRRVQRARSDRRRLSRNTATRRMENKGRRKMGGESVSKKAVHSVNRPRETNFSLVESRILPRPSGRITCWKNTRILFPFHRPYRKRELGL